MKNTLIKEEILRIQEIMGVSLLIESKLPSSIWTDLVSTFSKTSDDELEAALKATDDSVKSLSDSIVQTASKKGLGTDDIIKGLRAGNLADDVAENLFANILKSSDGSLKTVFLKNIDNNIKDIFEIASNSSKKVSTSQGEKTLQELADMNQLDGWVNAQKKLVDESDFDTELTDAIKKQIDLDVAKIKSGKSITVDSPKTLDELHSVLSSRAKAAGYEPPTVVQLKTWQDELRRKYRTPDEAWNDIIQMLEKSKTLKERVKIVSDTVSVTTAEGKNLLSLLIRNNKGKIAWGTIIGITAALSILSYVNLSESEANSYINRFKEDCPKLEGSIRKRKDISATPFEEFMGTKDNYYIEVAYGDSAKPVTIKDNQGYIEVNGESKPLSELCSDPKLGEGQFEEDSNDESNISDATVEEFKEWYDTKGYKDYTSITINGKDVIITVDGQTYNYEKIADNQFK